MTATTARPTWYDTQLTAYRPFIRKLARKAYRRNSEDLEQQICERAMLRWHIYDPTRYKFGTWLVQVARNCVAENRETAGAQMRSAPTVSFDDSHSAATPPNQLDYAELSQVLRRLSGTRDSEALIRVAMGEEMPDVANDMGVSRQRVFQLCQRERARLVAA